MPWIKAELSDETHRALKVQAAQTDRRLQDVAAEILERHAEDDLQVEADA